MYTVSVFKRHLLEIFLRGGIVLEQGNKPLNSIKTVRYNGLGKGFAHGDLSCKCKGIRVKGSQMYFKALNSALHEPSKIKLNKSTSKQAGYGNEGTM